MKEFITEENKKTLEAELFELSVIRRRDIVSQVEYAKSLGDLSENAEYHQAREAQGKLEERIRQIEHVLKHAEVIERTTDGIITIGSSVTIQKRGEVNTRIFQIVGSEETDMMSGKISYKSPLGQALFGKKIGESANVITPKGEMVYDIVHVA